MTIFIYNKNLLLNMLSAPVKIGTRRLQRCTSAFAINVPPVVMNTLAWAEKDDLTLTIELDGSLRIAKE